VFFKRVNGKSQFIQICSIVMFGRNVRKDSVRIAKTTINELG